MSEQQKIALMEVVDFRATWATLQHKLEKLKKKISTLFSRKKVFLIFQEIEPSELEK